MVTQDELNEKFMEVIRWLKSKGYSQAKICEKAQIGASAISKIKNGENNVGDKTIAKLCDAFDLNPDFFYGRSQFKSLNKWEEVESELADIHESHGFPAHNQIELSSVFNSALAAKDEAIESLKRELITKDDLIQSLRDQIATKDQIIAEQKARLVDYRRIIDSQNEDAKFLFPVGSAEGMAHK